MIEFRWNQYSTTLNDWPKSLLSQDSQREHTLIGKLNKNTQELGFLNVIDAYTIKELQQIIVFNVLINIDKNGPRIFNLSSRSNKPFIQSDIMFFNF